jgi:hypothetical protein
MNACCDPTRISATRGGWDDLRHPVQWAKFYANEALRNPNNPSAAGRADLMQHAADLLRQ